MWKAHFHSNALGLACALASMLVVGCHEPAAPGSQNVAPLGTILESYAGAPSSDPKQTGQISFPPIDAQWLTRSHERVVLQLWFDSATQFPLASLKLGLDGIHGDSPAYFNLVHVSQWMPESYLEVEVGRLQFENHQSFLAAAKRIQSQLGKLVFWYKAPQKVVKALLVIADGDAEDEDGSRDVVVLDTFPLPATNPSAVSFSFHSPQGAVRFDCSLDGAAFTHCTSPIAYSNLASGRHRFEVRAVSLMGISGPITRYDFNVAHWQGGVALTSETPSHSPTNLPTMTLAFQATGVSSPPGLAGKKPNDRKKATPPPFTPTFGCSLDGGKAVACTSPVVYQSLSEGAHTVTIARTDIRGGGATASYGWVVDLTPPEIQLLSSPPVLTNVETASFTFEASEPATFSCSLDGAAASSCLSGTTYASLVEGTHVFSVTATDTAGNVSAPTAYRWTIDVTPPVLTLGTASPAQNPNNSTSLSASFSLSEPATLACTLDGNSLLACPSPLSFTGLAAGEHTLTLTPTDLAGNVGQTVTYAWVVDLSTPILTVQMASPVASPTRLTTATFSLSAVENGPGVNGETYVFTCSLDGAIPSSCVSPVTLTDLAEGTHQLAVVAEDAAGNSSAPTTVDWQVDLTPPVITVTNVVPSGAVTADRTIEVDYSVSKVAAVTCNLDQAGEAPCSSPFLANNLADGNHQLVLNATDAAGNTATPITYTWEVAPQAVVEITSVSPSSSLVNTPQITFAFTSSETKQFQCALDAGAFAPCTSPLTETVADGAHTFQVEGINIVGVPGTPASYSWTVDTTAPVIAITGTTPEASITSSTSESISFSVSETATVQCALDGAAAAACTSPYTASNLSYGAHQLVLSATDAAGNPSTPVSYSWQVAAPATVTLTGETPSQSPTSSTTISLTFSSTGATSFLCSLDAAPAATCSSPAAYSGLANGTHTFQVRAVNAAGEAGAPASYGWSVDSTPPVITITGTTPSTAVTSSQDISVAFTVTKSATVFCSLDGSAPAHCLSPYTASKLSYGNHALVLSATDSLGNVAQSVTYAWQVAAPATVTITGATPANSLTNQTSISVSFSSTQASSFLCAFDGGGEASCTSPATASGLGQGTHTFQVWARNAAGDTGTPATYSWTIDTTAPVVSLAGETPSYTPTTSSSESVSFTASESATFACSLDGGASVACASPYSATGLGSGAHSLSITATDAAGNVSAPATYDWTVNTSPLTLSGFGVSNVAATSATLIWSTSVPASSQLSYGAGSLSQTTPVDPTRVTSHSVQLDGLSANTLYEVQATSTDADGRQVTSTILTFRTNR